MSADNEELMRLLMRTASLIRRRQHEAGNKECDTPGRDTDEPRGRNGHAGRMRGRHHHPGPPPPPHAQHAQGRVLAMLSVKEGQSQKELAYLLGIRPQSLSEVLLKLEGNGQIQRKKSETDGRVVNVYLTEKGRKDAEEAADRRRQAAEDMFAVLDEEEKDELSKILGKIADTLDT